VTPFALNELVNGGLLAPTGEGAYPAWMVPPASDREPNPSYGYVVSFIRLHERGFTAPVGRFMQGLRYHYGVELHNFAPNAISQAATFVAVCEGFLGIPAIWDLWVHLFCAELHTLVMGETRVQQAVRVGGLTFALRDSRKELYPSCTMTLNNADWEKGWFYLRNDGAGLPPTPARCWWRRPTPGTMVCRLPHVSRGWSRSPPRCGVWRTPDWERPRSSPTSTTGGLSPSRRGSSTSTR
jgi:hypothetical protein